MKRLGSTAMTLHVTGELVMVAAGAWSLYLRLTHGMAGFSTRSWFGPLALLSLGLFLTVLPLAPAWQAAWIRDWFREQTKISSLLWSCGSVGCLYSLWLQYQLEFNLRTVLLLLPAILYWFVVSCPGRVQQERNIARAAARENADDKEQEVQHA